MATAMQQYVPDSTKFLHKPVPYSRPALDLHFYNTTYGSHFGYNERQNDFNKHHGFEYTERDEDFFSMNAHSTLNTYPLYRRDALGFRRDYPKPKALPLRPQGQPCPPNAPRYRPQPASIQHQQLQQVPTLSQTPRVPRLRLQGLANNGAQTARACPPSRPRPTVRAIRNYTPRTHTPRVYTGRYNE